ncbi:family 43 glycosylhydrolase [uncultured Hymenobacter sp.]|uniref:glycoside hydrolase family 43 protein n=1 Tax=uncultured Hymenobacter sp. TaxID=170016 RepID=UPI0035CBE739
MLTASWLRILLLLSGILTPTVELLAQVESKPASTFMNPLREDGPDPWVTRQGPYYYYTNTTGRNLTIWKTKALSEIAQVKPVVVWTPPATGMNSDAIWAPELHQLDGKWYFYYTATNKVNSSDNTRYVFVLENASADPTTGTWVDKGKINTRYSGLDGSVFEHGGQRYFLYSAYVGPQSVLAIAPMDNPWTLRAGKEVVLAQPTYAWEKGGGRQILEGPEFLPGRKGQLNIVYSASACWDDNYALGMLTAAEGSDLLRPESWRKAPQPVFRPSAQNGVWGTGHNSFTKSPDGREDWIVYHAKAAADGKCAGRSSRAQRFTWNPDGTPNFGEPASLLQPQPRPSGE